MGEIWHSVLYSFRCLETLKKIWFDANLVQLGAVETKPPDQISELPDDILALVLSKLSLREAACSSVLSHRWRHLYWKFTTNLNFDEGSSNSGTCRIYEANHSHFVKRVYEILESKEACILEQLRIRSRLDSRFKHDIENWVEYAFSKRVQKFHLDLSMPNTPDRQGRPNFLFFRGLPRVKKNLFGYLKKTSKKHSINFNFFRIFFAFEVGCPVRSDCSQPPKAGSADRDRYTLTYELFNRIEGTCFTSLKELQFRDVDISEELVNSLLKNCPNLERLSVVESPSLVIFKVTGGPHSVLKFLELSGVFDSVEISDMSNLICLSVHHNTSRILWPFIQFKIENAPSLVDLRIGGGFVSSYFNGIYDSLFTNLSCSLKSLTMKIISNVCYENICRRPTMTALEKLVVQTTISDCRTSWSAYLTRLFPSLREFLFQAAWHDSMDIPDKRICDMTDDFHRECLKEVKIAGYYGCLRDVEIARYFFDCAVGLQRIIIDPHDQTSLLLGLPQNDCDTDRERAARSRAKEQLEGIVPAGVELVVL